ncbi:MAG: outer membrane beta-barrel domain-containing protein [Bradymonadales bacterium]|nr:outer membrane beta-barrel domain-containing protein [Bradymonadales bacterium]
MRAIRIVMQAFLVLLTVLVAPVGWAQEGGGTAADPLPEQMEEYWAAQRDIRIIQHRLFEKVGRHQITLFGGVIPNDPFMDYYPIGLRYNYYLLESLALELAGSFIGDVFRAESELNTFLDDHGVTVTLLDRQWWRAHFGVNWSPFYGKLAFLGLKLAHFDLNLHAGFGILEVHSLSEDRLREDVEYKPEGSLGAGFNFYLTDMFSVCIDYRQYIFEKAGGGVSNPSEITLGFSIFL